MFHLQDYHLLWLTFPSHSVTRLSTHYSPYPICIATYGLASSAFARHYSQNLVWFLFLRLLRCFSSAGSLPYTMDSCMDHRFFTCVVSQFGNLRIEAYLQLPAAYRSLSRPSSAPDAKAFTLCSSLLELLSFAIFAWVSQIICYNEKAFSFVAFATCAFCFLVRLLFRACGQIVVFHDFQKDLQNYFANL